MRLSDLLDRWRQRRDLYREDGALVSGEKIAAQVVHDLEAVLQDEAAGELVTLTAAARQCGYSTDTLRRKLQAGELTNYGEKHRPLVRLCDLPRRAGCLLNQPASSTFSRTGIARAAITDSAA